MTYSDEFVTIRHGDSWELASTLAPQSINTIVTSPPYWGLRDYGEPGQFGLEPTPEAYVARLVELFALLRPALRDDGTIWLNLGDSYVGTGNKGEWTDPKHPEGRNGQSVALNQKVAGMKSKDLCGIPWMVAFALRADGWYLRQDIIWHKPNPMPESVTDRCTKAHEYIFLLSKSPRYYYDADALREPHTTSGAENNTGQWVDTENVKHGDDPRFQTRPGTRPADYFGHPLGRNKRDVWTCATKPFSAAHFATFPPDLIRPCILAGCPEGGTVLDPFMGSGTTAQVARSLSRKSIGFELNSDYIDIAAKHRLAQGVMF